MFVTRRLVAVVSVLLVACLAGFEAAQITVGAESAPAAAASSPTIVSAATPATGIGRFAGPGNGGEASAGPAHTITATGTDQPPVLSDLERQRLVDAASKANHAGPTTPLDPSAKLTAGPPTVPPSELGGGVFTGQAAATGSASLSTFVNSDLGSGIANLIPEPSASIDGHTVLETWNSYAAVSTTTGAAWQYINPYTEFPPSYGGFCCDQSAFYDASRDITIWVLQYNSDLFGNNEIRLAVAHGQQGLGSFNFTYWDLTPQQLGAPSGTNFDQPKVAESSNYLYLEATEYGAAGYSVVVRIPLDTLARGAVLTYQYYFPFLFSPGFAQGATSTMYFAGHVSTSVLRVFSWPESVGTAGINYVDVSHSAYPQSYPYQCPRVGGSTTSDWCQRRSFGGGYAHSDRIFSGWVANGVIGFLWDASQGTGGLGTFPYPYEHIVRINQATMTYIDEPIMWDPAFAMTYASLSPNARGDIAGTYMWGGGSYYENCGAFIWDATSTVPPQWETHGIEYSNSDPTDTLSGDYLSTRKNGLAQYSWVGTCYALVNGGNSGYVHPYFLWFGRPGTNAAPQVFLPIVAKDFAH